MAGVRLIDVTKTFGKVLAVDAFTLDIKDGEFVILVGPSGCGKSTILRLIAGLEEISSGEIYIGEKRVNEVHPKDRDIAMVFQNYALYPHMNVYDNMSFSLKQKKLPAKRIAEIVERSASMLGIQELLSRKPRQLSGGQRQRVALGRAIVRNPQVFLFDEPLSNLDAKLRIVMRAELLDLHEKLKTTTIYVTHDQVEAMTMGDRLVVMNRGHIQQVDTPQNLYDKPVNQFVAGFIGSPPMNFAECVVRREEGRICVTTEAFNLGVPESTARCLEPYVEKEVVLGLRPEHIADLSTQGPASPGTEFKASVWVVEPLGSEKYVHLRAGETTLVARLDPHITLMPGDKAAFAARMDQVHFFEKDTGRSISRKD
ncbi:MAG: sn-glycerol-3-phosphate ABC transporter ATP-binding protein UgpC [Deltaproteobacteria bacterium]|nr:sn-glycerol-3-phosphate ABC transporter ATP-binding protein UgpC [Deltaproteobacteria bacterium]